MSTLLKNSVNPSTTTVAVLCGGNSTEREISLASGEGAKAALEKAGFSVVVIDPADSPQMEHLKDLVNNNKVKVAFLCVHGKGGEDGTLQKTLEDMNVPYTGSGVEASSLAINKNKAKEIYRKAEILTPQSVKLNQGEAFSYDELVKIVGEHSIVKAAEGGSTLGIYIAETAGQLPKCIEEAFAFDNEIVIEQFITGNEFTVSVIGNSEAFALPVIQIIPKDGFYDFEAKYSAGGSKHLCPAPISEELTTKMQNAAVKAHRALGCKGMSRSDFIVDAQENAWILETNTIPGMTKTSLLPDAANAAGISFDELCTYFVELALEK